MSEQPPRVQTADTPLRPRLVLGWSLLYVFVFVGLGAAIWRGRAVPVLLDMMSP
ncbi:MAG: hypothetical protein KA761_12515 [Gemmatimonadaceae bacterium]|nr:hypothetical protein [Gemmatimonadaceae bacterium]